MQRPRPGFPPLPTAAPRSPSGADERAAVRALIGRMTLEEMVGQLFVARVFGTSASDPDPADVAANRVDNGVDNAAELVARYHLGGVVYFAWAHNTRDPHQIADLSNGIQRAGLAAGARVPLLVAVDQEQGAVERIGAPVTSFGGGMALGANGSTDDAFAAARIVGAELAAMGINQNYAPVCDVNVSPANPVIGVRAFGADPSAVAALVAAQIRGYQAAGVATSAKHFPGHGDTVTDSHVALPVITHGPREWERVDAPPFRAAIAAGVDSVMTAHILVPGIDDSGDPATLSHAVLTGLLRERLGYDGVVVTDALDMRGVRERHGDDRVPVLALKAGADQLLDPPRLDVAFGAVLAAVRSGEVSRERLAESVARVLRMKLRRGVFEQAFTTPAAVDEVVGAREHREVADAVTGRGVTLLVNASGVVPLARGTERRVLVVGADPAAPSGVGGPPTAVLARELTALGVPARALPTGRAPDAGAIGGAVAAARDGADAVVVTTCNVTADTPEQVALVAALVATGVPVVTVAVRNPYDAAFLPPVAASLATYGWTDVSMRAAARVLAGAVRPAGRLPVAIPRADDPGADLFPIGFGLDG
ncbi:glycoside hydrolase family 3 protein [Actinacidiphila rubida]|uniref:beta-N-acetylhexosaminidase n=1 Tax=Actinacidiphila rubida TaxID=310780 RepID=A0A1H8I4E9_9ACTN|nr:glycoside hydrolase family 3 protein [Actinacidiphila rubida]SEN63244.1 beta-N-acetylhexosaminidase [Actinacidiphila rubida]